jgi:hypothetical protein
MAIWNDRRLTQGVPPMLELHELEPNSQNCCQSLSRPYSLAVLSKIAPLTSVLRLKNLVVGTPRLPCPASLHESSPPCRSSP